MPTTFSSPSSSTSLPTPDCQVTRIFVSLETDQSTRYWIPISAIPTWPEFVAILSSIFHNDSPPTLYYVSDRRNIIHESVWQYREFLTQNGIFHVEFERPNEVVVRSGRREGTAVLDDSGQPVTLSPPPPYSPGGDSGAQQAADRGAVDTGIVSDTLSNPLPPQGVAWANGDTGYSLLNFPLPTAGIFSLHILIQTPHILSPSNTTLNLAQSQHLIATSSLPVSHIREIAKRLFIRKHPSAATARLTYTLIHKRFESSGDRTFPIRFDEMADGNTLGEYGCIDEDSRVEVTVRTWGQADGGSHPQSETIEWIREVERETGTGIAGAPAVDLHGHEGGQVRLQRTLGGGLDMGLPTPGTGPSLDLSWPHSNASGEGVPLGEWSLGHERTRNSGTRN